ncbi:hypothetical protein ABZ883_00040 [Streptomyces sp. NPDC046977]|uniref:hypothetical protein n=1 Tax=Streptomyces sp. NPDC046977 TaxID=3154703 RepID=UPI0033C53E13
MPAPPPRHLPEPPPPSWAADVARVLGATPTGERAGLRPALAGDVGRDPASADAVAHRIALVRAAPLPAGFRAVLGAALDAATAGGREGPGPLVRHELLDAAVGPAAPDREDRAAERVVRQAHGALVAVEYGELEPAARGAASGTRLGARLRALRHVLPTAVAAVGADRTAVLVLGADTLGVGARPRLREWSAAAVRRVLGEAAAPLTVVPVLPGYAAAAGTGREQTAAGLTELADRVLGPWTATAGGTVARLSARRYAAALRSARQGFARAAGPDRAANAPDPVRLLDPSYAAELRARFLAASCAPLTALALRALQEEPRWKPSSTSS